MQEQVVGFQLSLQQRRLWHAQQDGAAFRAQCVVAIEGEPSVKTLREALRRVVRRHEILRTTFCYLPGIKTPVQVIGDDAPYAWAVADLSDARDEPALERLCEREREAAFDPERGPVLRALLVEGGARRLLVLTLPALCADARTLTNLTGELSRAYDAALRGGEDDDEVVQYLQFSEWQNELLEEEEAAEGREFWRRLAGGDAPTLPFERNPADAGAPYRPSCVALALGPDLCARVREAARECGAPPDKFLLAAWQTLLWRLSGEPHVVVRAMFEGRKYEELSDALGLFAKWPPVAQRFEPGLSFREVVAGAQEAAHENHAWLEYFTGEGEGGAGEGASEESARGDGVGFEFSAWPEAFAAGGLAFALERQYACCERFKLNLSCVESGGALAAQFYYDPARLSREEVERLADEFRVLLESAARAPDSPAGRLDVVGDAERARLLFEFNRTASPAPPAPCAHMLFERQAESTPGRVAAAAAGRSLTYAELNARANQLARHLRGLGVGRETPVALFVERGLEMVVALLGVLKAGGAYVPLDTGHPRERLAYMLTDSQARFILTQEHLAGRLPEGAPRAVRLDADWPEVERESAENPEHAVGPDNLAYVIYTSGSTGAPKGVMVTHGGLVNYLHWARSAYIREESPLGAPVHSPAGFDLTVTSLFCPLLAGQSVELIAEGEGVEGLAAALRRGSASSLVKLTPAHLDLLARSIPAEEAAGAARALVIGGEALLGDSLTFWREHAPRTRLINEYGPTETVVGCCVHEVSEGEALDGVVPIGRPIANTRMYVLDEWLRPTPTGAAGELYVGGAGVARGYLGRADLTAERFVPDGLSGEAGARLYRTGDVGRVRGDGVFEYLGRNDEQVKLRGYRIELGEVEAVLKEHPEVQDAAVSTHAGSAGDRELVAYLVAREGQTPPAVNQLRQHLGAKLPDYMIPSAFVTLRSLPLTANGKVDRRALPAPGQERPELEAAYVAPIYGLEFQLVQIWEDVLGVRPIGVTDNFFDLKGHSILAMRVMALVQRLFGQEFPISLLFEAPTIRQLAEALRQQAGLFSKTPLVRLQSGEAGRRPFFCVHAVGGTVMCYIALARHLGADQPFYAFQAPDPETPPTTVEEIAAHYVEVMRSVQPRGPYLLGGWSFGGVAAFEMAQQLTRQGERVGLLALFDRPAPVFNFVAEGETYDDVDEPRAMVRIAMEMAGQYARELPISFEHFETLGRTEQMEYVLAQAKRIELLPQEFQLSQMLRLLRGYKARAKAVFNYEPRPYAGPLTLFRASEIDPEDMNPELLALISRDPTMGWGQFLAEPPRIIWVPGFHGTMVQEPHVEVLAEKLRACIELTETE